MRDPHSPQGARISKLLMEEKTDEVAALGPAAVPELLFWSSRDQHSLRMQSAASTALMKIGPAALDELIKGFNAEEIEIRIAASQAFNNMGMFDESKAFGEAEYRRALPYFLSFFNDPDFRLKSTGIARLAGFCSVILTDEYLPLVEQMLWHESEYWVARRAVDSLAHTAHRFLLVFSNDEQFRKYAEPKGIDREWLVEVADRIILKLMEVSLFAKSEEVKNQAKLQVNTLLGPGDNFPQSRKYCSLISEQLYSLDPAVAVKMFVLSSNYGVLLSHLFDERLDERQFLDNMARAGKATPPAIAKYLIKTDGKTQEFLERVLVTSLKSMAFKEVFGLLIGNNEFMDKNWKQGRIFSKVISDYYSSRGWGCIKSVMEAALNESRDNPAEQEKVKTACFFCYDAVLAGTGWNSGSRSQLLARFFEEEHFLLSPKDFLLLLLKSEDQDKRSAAVEFLSNSSAHCLTCKESLPLLREHMKKSTWKSVEDECRAREACTGIYQLLFDEEKRGKGIVELGSTASTAFVRKKVGHYRQARRSMVAGG